MKRTIGLAYRIVRNWWEGKLVLAAAMGLALAASVGADTVTLKNGQVLEGRVLEETAERVSFQTVNRVVLHLDRERIESVELKDNPLILEEKGDKALREKRYDEAIAFFEEAIELKGPKERMQPKIDQARKAKEAEELGPHAVQVKEIRSDVDSGRLDEAEQGVRDLMATLPAEHSLRKRLTDIQADIHYQRALDCMDSINYRDAETELRAALRLNPLHYEACVTLAQLTAQVSSKRDEAVKLYQRVLNMGEDRLLREQKLELRYNIADLFEATRNYASAAKNFGEVYREDPDFRPDLEQRYVRCLERVAGENEADNPRVATEALDRVLAIQPYDTENREKLADNLMILGEYRRAIDEYERVLNDSPGRRRVNYNIAMSYLGMQQPIEAREYLEQEVRLSPNNYDALLELGGILVRVGDYEEAKNLYLRAREINPDDTKATIALASAERVLGNYNNARRYLSEVLAQDRDDVQTNLEMGLLEIDERRLDEAEDYLDKVIKELNKRQKEETLNSEEKTFLADAYLARGEVNLLKKGPSTAQDDFNKALEIYPDYPAAYYNIGTAYEKKYNSSLEISDLKQAEENMLKARELAPQDPLFAFGLGVLYHDVLAGADEENESEYFRKAVENYRDYIRLGGARVNTVQNWINDLSKSL